METKGFSSSSSCTQQTMVDRKQQSLSRLLRQRRLVVVLDLDHTLLHTTEEEQLTPAEMDLFDSAGHPQDMFSVRFPCNNNGGSRFYNYFATKLRPGARRFVQELSEFADVYIYTHGDAAYANSMACLLDPTGVGYFSRRIFSREDCPVVGKKTLDIIPEHESLILLLDDSPEVWEKKNAGNLFDISPYNYFNFGAKKAVNEERNSSTSKKRSFAETGGDEDNNVLEFVLTFFRLLHKLTFDPQFDGIKEACKDGIPSLLAKIREGRSAKTAMQSPASSRQLSGGISDQCYPMLAV